MPFLTNRMNPIDQLAKIFKEFPGIGERQAKRFVYFLLHKNPMYVKELGDSILTLKNNITMCPSCFLFFQGNKDDLCTTCQNTSTDKSLLLIVEKDADFESVKKSKTYNGMYFILGGLVPIVTKETPSFVRTKELIRTIEERATKNNLTEVVLALSLSPQGENTDMYLREIISPLQSKYNFRVVSLGRGLSTGTELEYSDSETIKNALQNRS